MLQEPFGTTIAERQHILANPFMEDLECSGFRLRTVVAQTIKNLRKQSRLSQTTLTHKLNMKQPALVRIERAHTAITLDTLERLAAALGYTVEVTFKPGNKHV